MDQKDVKDLKDLKGAMTPGNRCRQDAGATVENFIDQPFPAAAAAGGEDGATGTIVRHLG